jgi:2-dehydro-3-deoxygluconokinase
MRTDGAVVCFGELLIRLAAPGVEMLLQSPRLNVCVGGAEANVAVALSCLGHQTRFVTVASDNALGQAARNEVRRYGVDTSGVQLVPGRMGLYFLTPGAIRRSPEIIYDRAESAFAQADAAAVDWSVPFAGAGWFHISGITPAVSQRAADAALRAIDAARAAGLTISFDCNYRSKLWEAWKGDGPGTIRKLVERVDVLFGDHRDVSLILGRSMAQFSEAPRLAAAKAAFEAFPNLKRMACTQRVQHSVDHHDLSGFLFAREGSWTTSPIPLFPIVDRIGGGDAFAAGVIHGLARGWDDQRTLDFAVTAGGLKHALPGDFPLASEAEVLGTMTAEGFDVRR